MAGCEVKLPRLVSEIRGRSVRNHADGADWVTHMAYVDDTHRCKKLGWAKGYDRSLCEAFKRCGLELRGDKLAVWGSIEDDPICIGARIWRPALCSLVCFSPETAWGRQHRIAANSARFWAVEAHLLTKLYPRRFGWPGCVQKCFLCSAGVRTSWHMRRDLDAVEAAAIGMARLVLRLHRPADERWLGWHVRTWRAARQGLIHHLWCSPAAIVAALAR